jgi:hypothetical protein
LTVDKGRHPVRRQNRPAVDQNDVKSDAQIRVALCSRDGIIRRWGPNHEARGVQYAALMRGFDSHVDLYGGSKIVGRYDQAAP